LTFRKIVVKLNQHLKSAFCLKLTSLQNEGVKMTVQLFNHFENLETLKCRRNRLYYASRQLIDVIENMVQDKNLPPTKRRDVSHYDIETIMRLVIQRDYVYNPPGLLSYLRPKSDDEAYINKATAIHQQLEFLGIRDFQEWVNWVVALEGVSEFFGDYIKERLGERGLI